MRHVDSSARAVAIITLRQTTEDGQQTTPWTVERRMMTLCPTRSLPNQDRQVKTRTGQDRGQPREGNEKPRERPVLHPQFYNHTPHHSVTPTALLTTQSHQPHHLPHHQLHQPHQPHQSHLAHPSSSHARIYMYTNFPVRSQSVRHLCATLVDRKGVVVLAVSVMDRGW